VPRCGADDVDAAADPRADAGAGAVVLVAARRDLRLSVLSQLRGEVEGQEEVPGAQAALARSVLHSSCT